MHSGANEKVVVTMNDQAGRAGGLASRPRRTIRVALYSHDTMGIGHMRRNALIAQCLADGALPVSILLVAGSREAASFPLPDGVDCLTLPAFGKDEGGGYRSRNLDLTNAELIRLRADSLAAALEAFAPDLFVVDKVPRGALRELDAALQMLRRKGRTRCVLGLRDVLDEPDCVRRDWKVEAGEEAVREFYDRVWIYGDPAVYDLVHECRFSRETAAKVRFTGYLARQLRRQFSADELAPYAEFLAHGDRLAVCMVGGGQDGAALAEAFARAPFPNGMAGLVLTGPFMPAEARQRLLQQSIVNPRLHVLRFVTEPDLLLSLADRVITMGGYNSTCEVVATGKPALIVPRVRPRREQIIRAERLRDFGLVDVLHPDDLTPQALSGWLSAPARTLTSTARVRWNGLSVLPRMVDEVLAGPHGGKHSFNAERRFNRVPN